MNWLKLMIVAAIACTAAAYAADPVPVKGNPDSKIYHNAACRHYSAKSSTKEFKSEAEAVKDGYTPCKQCAAPKALKKAEKAE
jgi:methylphosphotriester-DNA--protein-cysteine methyltransferase